ncbi:MAG: TIGR00730 family Rossman fold protein [Bdellovibrio sp.]
MKSVCVFCGSSIGNDPGFQEQAWELGKRLASDSVRLIYGGSKLGIMGEVANAVLKHSGEVTGVLPKFLGAKESAHPGLTELIWVETMHQRKNKMFELSEGFIALPGGIGTLEEVCEILTWQQLGLHRFPIGFLNVGGFYDPLFEQFKKMEEKALLRPEVRNMAIFSSSVSDLLHNMHQHRAPVTFETLQLSQT